MINSVVLMGRLANEPELRTTTSGKEVCSFTIAVDPNYVAKGQEKKTNFLNCVAWNQTAKFIRDYFAKGNMIAVTGEITTRNYEDKSGAKRTATEILVNNASFCGSKESGNNSAREDYSPEIIEGNDDLPF